MQKTSHWVRHVVNLLRTIVPSVIRDFLSFSALTAGNLWLLLFQIVEEPKGQQLSSPSYISIDVERRTIG